MGLCPLDAPGKPRRNLEAKEWMVFFVGGVVVVVVVLVVVKVVCFRGRGGVIHLGLVTH